MVGARRYEEDPTLVRKLRRDFNNLLWSTIQDIPQPYHVAKALCLLCSWPLPMIQDFKDPTYHLSGIMIQIGYQNMLHLSTEEHVLPWMPPVDQKDRLMTWAACSTVAQT